MGVHNESAYPEIKRLLGIPEDEPIFILRAKDEIAGETIEDYSYAFRRRAKEKNDGMLTETQRAFQRDVMGIADSFFAYQNEHPDLTRLPD